MEYKDPNGEIYTAQARTTMVAFSRADRHQDIRLGDGARKLVYDIITTDVTGKTCWRHQVQGEGLNRTWESYRKRNIGGFYSYESSERKSDPWCALRRHLRPQRKVHLHQQRRRLGRNTVHRRGRRQQWPDGKRWHFNVGIQRRRLDVPLGKLGPY